MNGDVTYDGPTPGERYKLALAVLREHSGLLSAADVADRIGCGRRQLTGSPDATLFLLEVEGLVGRVGNKRGVKWFAYDDDDRR